LPFFAESLSGAKKRGKIRGKLNAGQMKHMVYLEAKTCRKYTENIKLISRLNGRSVFFFLAWLAQPLANIAIVALKEKARLVKLSIASVT
jgi:hypothetical protein